MVLRGVAAVDTMVLRGVAAVVIALRMFLVVLSASCSNIALVGSVITLVVVVDRVVEVAGAAEIQVVVVDFAAPDWPLAVVDMVIGSAQISPYFFTSGATWSVIGLVIAQHFGSLFEVQANRRL